MLLGRIRMTIDIIQWTSPQRNHISKAIQMSARIGLITSSWPPYNTSVPYVYCTFVWHPYFPYISRWLRPYIKLKKVI